MSKKHFMYRICGKQYALENFYILKGITGDTMKVIPLTDEQRKEMAYLCITKGGKAGLDYVKRLERAEVRKAKRYLTYGFLTVENRKQYAYCTALYCSLEAPLHERKHLFDQVRSQFSGKRCKVEEYSECTLDGGYNPTDIKRHYLTADLSCPVLIHLVR